MIGFDVVPVCDGTVGVEQWVVASILLLLTVVVFIEMDAAWKRVREARTPQAMHSV